MNVNSRNPYFPFRFVNNIYDFFFKQHEDDNNDHSQTGYDDQKYNEYQGMIRILENDG